MTNLIDVVGIDKTKIISALENEGFKDYEDCLQVECAVDCGADYIVTRNVNDFEKSEVEAITPAEYLAILTPQPGDNETPVDSQLENH